VTSSLPPIDYDLNSLRADLIQLRQQLTEMRQREVGWIETAHVRVSYSDPEITASVQESTKRLGAALCVLYFMVVVEAYFPNTYKDQAGLQRNLWEEARSYGWLWASELQVLRAYRHVRHSYAHDPSGAHANQNKSAFNSVNSSNHPLPCISSDGKHVVVQSGASILMVNELHDIVGNVLARMMSSPEYGPKPAQ